MLTNEGGPDPRNPAVELQPLTQDSFTTAALSVIIFAQLGVYAYFAAAFVPVLFGTFLDDAPLSAVATAAMVALTVHYGLYYTGDAWFPYYQTTTVDNPGISTALAIVAATLAGGAVYLAARGRRPSATK